MTTESNGHLDIDALADYAEDLLDDEATENARRHIAACSTCAATAQSIADVTALLAAAPPEPMPAAVVARITAALASADAAGAAVPAASEAPSASAGTATESRLLVDRGRSARAKRWRRVPRVGGRLAFATALITVFGVVGAMIGFHYAGTTRPTAAARAETANANRTPPLATATPDASPRNEPTTHVQHPLATNGVNGHIMQPPNSPVPFTESGLKAAAKRLFASAPASTPSTQPPAAVAAVPGATACTTSTAAGSLTGKGGLVIAAEPGEYHGRSVLLLIYVVPPGTSSGLAVVVTTPCDTPNSSVMSEFPVSR
jgi:hypothetical protein